MNDIANLIISGSVFVIALGALTFAALVFFNAPARNAEIIYVPEPAQFTANASIGVSLELSMYMHTQLRLTVKGNNTDFSIGIDRQGIPFGVPIVTNNSSVTASSGISNSSIGIGGNASSSVPVIAYQLGNYYVLVPRLYPNSNYTVMVKGSAAPVCLPGRVCPDFIVGINDVYNVSTGPNGSITNITVSAV